MFYAHFVLASKGPLARIWLAAHWDKKLTKSHVFETNIESSVEGILQPKVKMALRTSGHLLLGIVRIYSRKAKYLLADCNEAYIKMRMAFRPGVVDLPEAAREAAVATITLPEVFHDFDSVPDIAIDFDNEVTLNQSRAEDITLKEDYGNLNLITEENFDAFDEPEAGRDATNMDEGFENSGMLNMLQNQSSIADEKEGEDNSKDIMAQSNASLVTSKPSVSLTSFRDDGFGGTCGVGLLEDAETGGLFEPAGLFDDAPLDNMSVDNTEAPVEPPLEKPSGPPSAHPAPTEDNDSDDDMYDMGGGMSPGCPSGPSSPECENNEVPEPEKLNSQPDNQMNSIPLVPEVTAPDILSPVPEVPPPPEVPPEPVLDHQVSNEEETFALAPLDTTIVHGAERTVKTKRKRKLIVDDVKNISGEEMKAQLSDTTDIVVTLDLAPPTKRLMLWKESGGVEKLFALSGLRILSRRLSCQYQLHLSTRTQIDDFQDDLLHTLEELPRQQKDESEDIGLNNGPARKRPRRDMNETLYHHDFSQLDNTPYLEKDSHYSDPSLSHPPRAPSIDPNYLQEQMLMNPPHEMMANVMQHPPPAHMMPMFPPNVPDQLAHLNDSLLQPHPAAMVNQVTPLSMSTAIPNIPSPVVQDAFNPPRFMSPDKNMHAIVPPLDSQQTHLLSHNDAMPNQMENQSPMNQFQDQLPLPTDSPNILENNMQPHSHILSQAPQVDEDATCLNEDFANTLNNTNALPPAADPLLSTTDKEPLEDRNLVNDLVNHAVSQEKSPVLSAFDQLAQQPSHNLVENSIAENSTAEKNDAEKIDFNMSDDDDYGAPASVGPTLPEEQMADETYEQFEERILSKRTIHMLHIINGKLDRDNRIHFADVVRNNKRKQVAQKFYTFLVLKKQQAVELEQSESYGDLIITRGPKFDAVYNSN